MIIILDGSNPMGKGGSIAKILRNREKKISSGEERFTRRELNVVTDHQASASS